MTARVCSLLILSAVACSPPARAEDDFLEGLKKDKAATQKPASPPATTPAAPVHVAPTMTPARLVTEPAAPAPTVRPGGDKKPVPTSQNVKAKNIVATPKAPAKQPDEKLAIGDRIAGPFVITTVEARVDGKWLCSADSGRPSSGRTFCFKRRVVDMPVGTKIKNAVLVDRFLGLLYLSPE